MSTLKWDRIKTCLNGVGFILVVIKQWTKRIGSFLWLSVALGSDPQDSENFRPTTLEIIFDHKITVHCSIKHAQ